MGKTGKITLTPEQEMWLVAHFRHTTNPEIARRLGISETTMHRFARELGLTKSRQHMRKTQANAAAKAKASHLRNGTYPPKVEVIRNDFTLTLSYVAKIGRSFAHGDTPREAVEAATEKDVEDRPLEERIDLFFESHPDLDTPYGDLFRWHHTLTGSCEFGRKEWCRMHGYQPTDSITVRTFLEQTRNDYGGDAIRQLAERYGLTM